MGDLLGSLTKPHTVIVWWLNWGQYRLEGDQGSLVEGVRPCLVRDATFCLWKRRYNETPIVVQKEFCFVCFREAQQVVDEKPQYLTYGFAFMLVANNMHLHNSYTLASQVLA